MKEKNWYRDTSFDGPSMSEELANRLNSSSYIHPHQHRAKLRQKELEEAKAERRRLYEELKKEFEGM